MSDDIFNFLSGNLSFNKSRFHDDMSHFGKREVVKKRGRLDGFLHSDSATGQPDDSRGKGILS
jgi:hypothetical protein